MMASLFTESKHPRGRDGKFVDVIGRMHAMGGMWDADKQEWEVPQDKSAEVSSLLDDLGLSASQQQDDRPGVGASFFHGTSKASARRIREKGLDSRRIFMSVSDSDDAIGTEGDDDVVEVVATPKNPLSLEIPALPPGEVLPTAAHVKVLQIAKKQEGIRFTPDEIERVKSRRSTYEEVMVDAFRARGIDAIFAYWEGSENWFMTWEPGAVRVI